LVKECNEAMKIWEV